MKEESDTLERAVETIQAIIEADPAIGPIEVVYINAQDDILANRFAMLVNAEAKLYLFDRKSQRRTPLRLKGGNFDERLRESKAIARDHHLGTVFVVAGTTLFTKTPS